MIPRVFVSSTIKDLQHVRDAIRELIMELGYQPAMSEHGEVGYSHLAMILERQKHFGQAIEVYSQAMRQGWGGNWEKHIQRCKTRMQSAS